MTENTNIDRGMRRVRPWIAALLTLPGWGVGLFYAGKTRVAIRMAVLQAAISVVLAIALYGYFYFGGPPGDIRLRDAADLIGLGLGAVIALWVWGFVSRSPRTVARRGRVRLIGYFAIWLLPLAASVALALVVRGVVLHPFHTHAGSMAPTLNPGQVFFVNKWSYGYSRFSVAPLKEMFPEGRLFGQQPERGDIVVFRPPPDIGADYVNRLIGMPGDEIRMIGGHLYINGAATQKTYLGLVEGACAESGRDAPLYRETLDNGVSYEVFECFGDMGPLDNAGPFVVPEGHYFMLGDNRDLSQDSRVLSAVGFIPYDHLVGKVTQAR